MAYRKTLLILCVILSLTSCRTKKETSTTFVKDTIYTSKVITIDNPQLTEIFIDNVCDSLGRLKVINYTSNSNSTKTILKSDKNTLKLSINIDSIISSEIEKYKGSIKTEKEVIIKEVKRPLNLWVLLYSILATLWILRKPLLKLILPL